MSSTARAFMLGLAIAATLCGQEKIIIVDDVSRDTSAYGTIEGEIDRHAPSLDAIYCAYSSCSGPDTLVVEILTDEEGWTTDVFVSRFSCRNKALSNELAMAIKKWDLSAFKNGEIIYSFTFERSVSCTDKAPAQEP